MKFCVQAKDQPGTYFLDKKTFAEVTANAQHHLVENRKQPLSQVTVVSKPNLETPLRTPTLNFENESKLVTTFSKGKAQQSTETPLTTPVLNFGDEDN